MIRIIFALYIVQLFPFFCILPIAVSFTTRLLQYDISHFWGLLWKQFKMVSSDIYVILPYFRHLFVNNGITESEFYIKEPAWVSFIEFMNIRVLNLQITLHFRDPSILHILAINFLRLVA